MIPKISSGSSIQGAIQYNEKEKATLIHIQNMTSDRHLDIETCKKKDLVQVFDEWNMKNPNVKKNVFHASLNFSYQDTDNLTEEKMVEIGQEFMEKMGYKDVPFVVYKHEDKNHSHIHILASRVGENGKRVQDKDEVKRAIEISRNLEIKHGLFRVVSGKENKLKGTEDLNQMSYKNKLLYLIDNALHKTKVKDLAEFNNFMQQQGITMSIKDFTDIDRKGFSFKDEQNQSILYGSDLHKSLYKKLERKFASNNKTYAHQLYKKAIQELAENISINKLQFINAEAFERHCAKFMLTPIYQENSKSILFKYQNTPLSLSYSPMDSDIQFLPYQLKEHQLIPRLSYIQTSLAEKQSYDEIRHIGQIMKNIDRLMSEKALYHNYSFSDIVKELNARGLKVGFSYERNKFGDLQIQKFKLIHIKEDDKSTLPLPSKGTRLSIDSLSKLLAMEETKVGKEQFKSILKTLHQEGRLMNPSSADVLLLNKIEMSNLGTRAEDKVNEYLKRYLIPSLLVKDREEQKKKAPISISKPQQGKQVGDYSNEHYHKSSNDDNWILK